MSPASPPDPIAAIEPGMEYDVVIAGAGPFGLMLACELGRRGIQCLLLDAKTGLATVPKANTTQARTMEHFRRLGFADEIRSQGLPPDHPTDVAYFTRFSEHELARLSPPTARQARDSVKRLSGSWSAAELSHRISQKYVEATLLRHVRALPSVQLRFDCTLQAFTDRGSEVTVVVRPTARRLSGYRKGSRGGGQGCSARRSKGINTRGIDPFGQRGDAPCRPSPFGFGPESRDAALRNPIDTYGYRSEHAPCLAAFWPERDPFL